MTAGSSPDVRYQVFISSTFLDLEAERQEVIQAVLELDCFPAGMEMFPAADDEKWKLIESVIDDSDYYVLILGGRYGSVDDAGVSYTEREYDYAVKTGKPILTFPHGAPDRIELGKSERSPEGAARLEAFRAKVSDRMTKSWSTPQELGSVVSRSLFKAIRSSPAKGWVRADKVLTPEYRAEVADLRARLAETERSMTERAAVGEPEGTGEFASGNDETQIAYSSSYRYPGGPYTTKFDDEVDVTWDVIFEALGPMMFHEASERDLKAALGVLIARITEHDDIEHLSHETGARVSMGGSTVEDDSFDKVKVQLVALQLIAKSKERHGVHDKNTYWTLTPYGENYVMRLKAERKPSLSTSEPAG